MLQLAHSYGALTHLQDAGAVAALEPCAPLRTPRVGTSKLYELRSTEFRIQTTNCTKYGTTDYGCLKLN